MSRIYERLGSAARSQGVEPELMGPLPVALARQWKAGECGSQSQQRPVRPGIGYNLGAPAREHGSFQQEMRTMATDNRTETASLTWGDCPGVERDPERLAGAWTFGNTRLPLHAVFENLAGGVSIQEITEQFSVTEEQIRTVLAHAARMLAEDRLRPGESP